MITQIKMSTITTTTSTTSAVASTSSSSSSSQPSLAELRELAGKARAVPTAIPTGEAKGADAGPQGPTNTSPALPAAGVKPKKRKAQMKSVVTTDEDEESSSQESTRPHKKTRRSIPKKTPQQRAADRKKREQQEKEKQAAQTKAAAKARNLTSDRIAPNEICGHYNFQGCKRWDCHKTHVWDKPTQTAMAMHFANKGTKLQPGLIPKAWYAPEMDDLRHRHVDTLTKAEKLELAKLPTLNPWRPEASVLTGLNEVQKRELATQTQAVMRNRELHGEALTYEQRELLIRNGAAKEIKALIKAQTMAFLAEEPARYQTDEDRQNIIVAVTSEMDQKLAKLKAEHAEVEGPCYMQQERLEGIKAGYQACPVFRHRFLTVPPNSLGPLKYDNAVNTFNQGKLVLLVKTLTRNLYVINEGRTDSVMGFNCRFCRRTLAIPNNDINHITCACHRCLSVLYCSKTCRSLDFQEHMQSCFTHPGWECEEITKKREEIAKAEGKTLPVKIPVSKEPESSVSDQNPRRAPDQEHIVNASAEEVAKRPGDEEEDLDIVTA